jgi:hypothetical protein
VRITAVIFNILVAGMAAVLCAEKLGWVDPEWSRAAVQPWLVAGVWAFTLWSHALLADQILAYSRTTPEKQ